MASKPKPKGKGKGKARKPAGKRWMIVLAITAFWAAGNEPADLTIDSALVWGLTALSVAFLVTAGLALAGPALVLGIRSIPKQKPKEDEPKADEP